MGGGLVLLVKVNDRSERYPLAVITILHTWQVEAARKTGRWGHDATLVERLLPDAGDNAGDNAGVSVKPQASGSLTVTLGDTDLVPFDMGTFGSRSTPTMVPQVRRAAAGDVIAVLRARRVEGMTS